VSKPYGVGNVCLWQGGTLWIGHTLALGELHAHHAVQITLALGPEDRFRLRPGPGEPWLESRGIVVASHQPHAFGADGAHTAVIWVEPESEEGRILHERYAAGGVGALPPEMVDAAAPLLRDAYRATRDHDRLVRAAHDAIAALTSGHRPRRAVDERVLRAIDFMQGRLERPPTLAEAAAAAYLSPGRFRHLFVEETGMRFRPYLLWLRLIRAVRVLSSGESASTAAHAAGFADSAHLTRTFRRMLGAPPSAFRVMFGE
jgi:AraC-like DNA-binding protein